MEKEFREYCDSRGIQAEAPGNTGRSFMITIFDMNDVMNVIEKLKSLSKLEYVIACHEVCPTTGRDHSHVYVHYGASKDKSSIIKRSRPHHVDKCRGTPKECIRYVMKDVTDENPLIYEEGEQPHQGKKISESNLRELSVVEIAEIAPRDHQAYLKAREILLNGGLSVDDLMNRKKTQCFYIYGPSGCGKSLIARQLLAEYMIEKNVKSCDMVKFKNEFWTGVINGQVAWYDEFRDSHMKPDEFISFVDRMPQKMNIKGSSTLNRYEFIVITSVQGPNDIYRNVSDEPRKQWERRIFWINLNDELMKKVLNIEKYKI